MSRIDDLVAENCPEGIGFEAIGQLAECIAGATPSKTIAAYWNGGSIPWMSSGEVNKGTVFETEQMITQAAYDSCSTRLIPAGAVVMALAGQGKTRGTVARTRIALCTNQSLCAIVVGQRLDADFLFHYLRTQYQKLRELSSGDGTRGGLNLQMIRSFRVPVPPLVVQREIVRILDTFLELEAELEAELQSRVRQYHYYREYLLKPASDHTLLTLGEVGRVSMCKRVLKSETSRHGAVPFYKIGTFGGEPDAYISEQLFDSYRRQYPFPKPGDVLLSAAGTIGRAVRYDGEPAYFQDSNIVWVDNDESLITNRYLWHCYAVTNWVTDGGTIRRLYNDNIRRTPISAPPRREQERIADILDAFEALVSDSTSGLPAEMAARRRQHEFYRNRLLTFSERAA